MKNYLVICDPCQTGFMSTMLTDPASVLYVTGDEQMDTLPSSDLSHIDAVIILAELTWPGHMPDDFYGTDVAVALRMRFRMLAPICIISLSAKEDLTSRDETKFNILKARGTAFIRIPASAEEVENAFCGIIPLSQATLTYLSNMLVDVRHLIDHFRHVMRMNAPQRLISSSLKKIGALSSTGIYPKACAISDRILSAHSEGDEGLFYKASGELLELLSSYRQQSSTSPAYDEGPRYNVVVVDDNAEDLEWAAAALSNSFNIIPFRDSMEARRYIDSDTGNEIAAIISDWQLLKPGTGEHQEMLGFELLEYTARKGHYALFSLTSTDDTSALEVDQHLWFEHTMIAKDFHHGQEMWRMYIPIIRQKIERCRAVIASLPTGDGWTSDFKLAYRKEDGKNVAYKQHFTSLKDQYIHSRNSEGWHSMEAEVSAISSKLWYYYSRAMKPEERPFLFDLKAQWGMELNRDLKNVLIIRRLFLAFWFCKTKLDISFKIPGKGIIEDTVINIYSVLRHRYFNEMLEEREGYDAPRAYKDLRNAAKVFASQLAIEPNRLPQGILPEEKAWLSEVGIEIEGGNDNIYYPD